MKITIETIPHSDQRYPTCGDWQWLTPNHLSILVSDMGDWRKEATVGIHEAVEAILCRNDRVGQDEVDAFDMAYEKARLANPTFGIDRAEAGDSSNSPYQRQHCFATAVERMLIAALGIPWFEYEDAVEDLP